MPVGYTATEPGLLGQFASSAAQGLGAGLGQQAARGIGSLGALGARKLGITGPSQEEIKLLVEQGLTPEQAQAFSELNPMAQRQLLANLGEQKKAMQSTRAYETIPGMESEMAPEQALKEIAPEKASQEGAEEVRPEYLPKPYDIYKHLTQSGLDPKQAKDYMADYRKEYEKESKKAEDYIDENKKSAKDAKENNMHLERYYKLIQKGNLPPAAAAAAVKALDKGIAGFGFDVSSWLGADAEEAKKIESRFIKGAKNAFGSRVTNFDAEMWMKQYPELSRSDEGKLRNINSLHAMNDAAILTNKTIKEIIKENGGKKPVNIEQLVENRIGKELDELYKDFIEGRKSEAFPSYEKDIAQAQARSKGEVPGSLVAGLGGGLAGRALGGALGGSWGGPVGAVLGGLAGAGAGSYIPRAIQSAREGSRALEEQLGVPDVASGIRSLFGLGPIQR